MKKAVKIEIFRAEGMHEECFGVECTAERAFVTKTSEGIATRTAYAIGTWATDPWTRANAILAVWSETAPREGGYDKCDFKVTYEDGHEYEGRYDLTHMDAKRGGGYPSLEAHMKSFVECYSGRAKPAHMKLGKAGA